MIIIGGHVTFQVQTPEQKYALHIYNPIPMDISNPLQSLSGIRDQQDVLTSGLQWLSALSRDIDLSVQTPVPNTLGYLITQVETQEGEKINCALLTWIEGDLLTGVHKETIGRPIGDRNWPIIGMSKASTRLSSATKTG